MVTEGGGVTDLAGNDLAVVADEIGAGFIHKNSRTLLQEMRRFILQNFGFGEFIFRMPDGEDNDTVVYGLTAMVGF